MATPEQIEERIDAIISGPASVSTPAGTVVNQDVEKVIAAEKHLSARTGVEKSHRGFRFTKIVPPGAV